MADADKPTESAKIDIPLTPTVHALIAANGEWWRSQALMLGVQVDALKAEKQRMAGELEEASDLIASLQAKVEALEAAAGETYPEIALALED